MTPALPLRDVHEGLPPGWWPPAPGWWLLLVLAAGVATLLAWRWVRRRRRRAAILRLFDEAVARAHSPAEQVAAMSGLLRRAGRRAHPQADRLDGEEWLAFLDAGMPQPVFSAGAGTLLRDGGFRTDVDAGEAEALRIVARQRYLDWMQGA